MDDLNLDSVIANHDICDVIDHKAPSSYVGSPEKVDDPQSLEEVLQWLEADREREEEASKMKSIMLARLRELTMPK